MGFFSKLFGKKKQAETAEKCDCGCCDGCEEKDEVEFVAEDYPDSVDEIKVVDDSDGPAEITESEEIVEAPTAEEVVKAEAKPKKKDADSEEKAE